MTFHSKVKGAFTAEDSLTAAAARIMARPGSEPSFDAIHAVIFTAAGAFAAQELPGYVPYVRRVGLISGTRGLGSQLRRVAALWPAFEAGRATLEELLSPP